MARLDNIRRIVKEEYDESVRPTIERLAYILNPFMEQVVNWSNNRVDFNNLYQEVVTLKVIVDANGVPTVPSKFSTSKVPNSMGGYVISVQNLTNNAALLPNSPFVSFFSLNPYLFQVSQITGLTAGNQYQINLIVIGK